MKIANFRLLERYKSSSRKTRKTRANESEHEQTDDDVLGGDEATSDFGVTHIHTG